MIYTYLTSKKPFKSLKRDENNYLFKAVVNSPTPKRHRF